MTGENWVSEAKILKNLSSGPKITEGLNIMQDLKLFIML